MYKVLLEPQKNCVSASPHHKTMNLTKFSPRAYKQENMAI